MSKKDGQCNHRIWKGFYSHRCTRKDWKDGYCKYHHPDSVKKRREDVDARVTAKLAEAAALQDKQRRQSEENAQLREEVERLRDELRQSSIDHTRAEVERLREQLRLANIDALNEAAENDLLGRETERLREALAKCVDAARDCALQHRIAADSMYDQAEAALRREESP